METGQKLRSLPEARLILRFAGLGVEMHYENENDVPSSLTISLTYQRPSSDAKH